ncbi:MAG: signal peptidase I [Acutalibacteraceae bacterium]|nr:signal peptidase I [Acutalibacteraceae bacterium]
MTEKQADFQVANDKKRVKDIFDWVEVVLSAMLAVVIIFTLLFRVATIVGESMENTFFENQKVIISNCFYTPKAGDVVVVSRNADNNSVLDNEQGPIIKRVIATEGQQVNIDFKSGIVYVDGIALDEPYTKTPTNLKYDIEFPVYVPEGHIFCLGDNRNDSLDSRSSRIGMIDTRYVLGKVTFRILPFDAFGKVE